MKKQTFQVDSLQTYRGEFASLAVVLMWPVIALLLPKITGYYRLTDRLTHHIHWECGNNTGSI